MIRSLKTQRLRITVRLKSCNSSVLLCVASATQEGSFCSSPSSKYVFAPRAFRNTLYAGQPLLNGFMLSRPVTNMKIKLAAALLLFLIALSCSNSKLNSELDAELQPRNEPVKIGEMAPNFTLEDQNGQKVTLSALRGSAPTVLAFYRGNW
jgi:AhpC/TSA family